MYLQNAYYNKVILVNNGVPVVGKDLMVDKVCKEVVAPTYRCNDGDIMNPPEMTVTVAPQTDSNGKAKVTVRDDQRLASGVYHYVICTKDYLNSTSCSAGGASVTGDITIVNQ
jgi:hypothetical protein